jgi:hypothetical protein
VPRARGEAAAIADASITDTAITDTGIADAIITDTVITECHVRDDGTRPFDLSPRQSGKLQPWVMSLRSPTAPAV